MTMQKCHRLPITDRLHRVKPAATRNPPAPVATNRSDTQGKPDPL